MFNHATGKNLEIISQIVLQYDNSYRLMVETKFGRMIL